ncbi:hypothetical protein C8R46DRAFT_1087763 [Mycena filopes]|nr:hypothetical protein C8R46DRAFT_1087763 [Mycena filopes]
MILLFLATIIPAAVAALPGLSQPPSLLIGSQLETCRFHVGSREYDLCPLFDSAARPLLVKAGQAELYRLYFGFNHEHGDAGSSMDLGSHCPPGLICLFADKPHKDISISGAASIVTMQSQDGEDYPSLRFGAGRERAAIRLVCDSRLEVGEPTFLGVEGNLHSFVWRTRFGCESGAAVSATSESDSDSDTPPPPDDSTSDPSNPDDGSEQLLEGDRQRRSRVSTAIIFAIISIVILSLSIISYRHPDRLNFLLAEYVKPVFRRLSLPFDNISAMIPHSLKPSGEGRLVRWAHEDLELDEDIMVNGRDAYDDEPDEAGDESIPLRPSPRKGGRGVANYGSGSATSPFW